VRIDTSTICGTDRHILKGDVPETTQGTVLGHEAVGTEQLETLWARGITVATGLVDTYTIPRLMKLVSSGRLDPTVWSSHSSSGPIVIAIDGRTQSE
jgi:threonine dehydrogenase-like Zn-dependent dehydrogenase